MIMFQLSDYQKAMAQMAVASPVDAAQAMKRLNDSQEQLSKIMLDAAKAHIAASQTWANETIAAMGDCIAPADGPAALVEASGKFMELQAKAAPHYAATIGEITKTAQREMMNMVVKPASENHPVKTKADIAIAPKPAKKSQTKRPVKVVSDGKRVQGKNAAKTAKSGATTTASLADIKTELAAKIEKN
jgi:hypothetical protein